MVGTASNPGFRDPSDRSTSANTSLPHLSTAKPSTRKYSDVNRGANGSVISS